MNFPSNGNCFYLNIILLEPEFILHVAFLPSEHLHNAKHLLPMCFVHTLQIPLALFPLTHQLATLKRFSSFRLLKQISTIFLTEPFDSSCVLLCIPINF